MNFDSVENMLRGAEEMGLPLWACIMRADKRIIDAQTPGAADPFVALSSLNASDITFVVRVWVHTPDYWNVRFDLNKSLYTQLPQQGFEFAYPHMDVTLIKN